MIGAVAVGSLLIRLGEPRLNPSRFLVHVILVIINVFPSWIIQAYFKQAGLPGTTKNARAALSILSGILLALLLNYLCGIFVPDSFRLAHDPIQLNFVDFVRRLFTSFFLAMICFVVFNVVYTNDMLQKAQLENEYFKQLHLRAQLLSLQQQLSPHFLFNSLSTLKTIATDPATKTFVVQLSHVYRYMLNVNEREVTSLSEELSFIRSYLYILHQRFENALNVSIDIPADYHNHVIPPLSLQLLIENAIKHNNISAESPLHIEVCIQGEQLVVRNSLSPRKTPEESTRRGLQNIRERFQLLFRKEIKVLKMSESFVVNLPLISHESYHH